MPDWETPFPSLRFRLTARPMGTTRWEKRNIAEAIPIWKEELCTQCNHCVAACPHSAIRAKVVSPEALDGAPESLHSLDVKSRDMRGQKYVLQVAPEDCTGCNLCVEVCPAKDRQDPSIKAINMMSRLEHVEEEKVNYDFFLDLPEIDRNKLERIDIRTSQLITPLFEYSGRAPAAAKHRISNCLPSFTATGC